MAYVKVKDWSVEQVTDWLKGLDNVILPYIKSFLNNGVNGHQLLNLRVDDLEHLGVTTSGHQELILESVEHVRNFHYELDKENLQMLALRLSCAANSLNRELEFGDENATMVQTQTLSDVHSIISTIKPLVCWLDRSPFRGVKEYNEMKKNLLQLGFEMATNAHRDIFSEKPIRSIRDICEKLTKLADKIIQEISDPMILQPATLDLTTLKKKEQELGFFILPSNNPVHQIAEPKYGSPANMSSKIEEGDEIVQVNYQTVVGWQRKKVELLLQESPPEIVLTLKKRPRHTKVYGQIYMKPYRLPSKKRAAPYSRWNENLPSPRLLTIHDLPQISMPKTPTSAETAELDSETSSGSDSEPPDSPLDNGGRLYPLKPRSVLQRRNTITGTTPTDSRTNHAIEQYWKILKYQATTTHSSSYNLPTEKFEDDSLYIRDKSASCSHGLELSQRPTTVIGLGHNARKNSFKADFTAEKVKKNVNFDDSKIVIIEDNKRSISTSSLSSLKDESIDFIDEAEDLQDRSRMTLVNEVIDESSETVSVKSSKYIVELNKPKINKSPVKDTVLEDVHININNIIKKFDMKATDKPKVLPRTSLLSKVPIPPQKPVVMPRTSKVTRGKLDKAHSTPAYDLISDESNKFANEAFVDDVSKITADDVSKIPVLNELNSPKLVSHLKPTHISTGAESSIENSSQMATEVARDLNQTNKNMQNNEILSTQTTNNSVRMSRDVDILADRNQPQKSADMTPTEDKSMDSKSSLPISEVRTSGNLLSDTTSQKLEQESSRKTITEDKSSNVESRILTENRLSCVKLTEQDKSKLSSEQILTNLEMPEQRISELKSKVLEDVEQTVAERLSGQNVSDIGPGKQILSDVNSLEYPTEDTKEKRSSKQLLFEVNSLEESSAEKLSSGHILTDINSLDSTVTDKRFSDGKSSGQIYDIRATRQLSGVNAMEQSDNEKRLSDRRSSGEILSDLKSSGSNVRITGQISDIQSSEQMLSRQTPDIRSSDQVVFDAKQSEQMSTIRSSEQILSNERSSGQPIVVRSSILPTIIRSDKRSPDQVSDIRSSEHIPDIRASGRMSAVRPSGQIFFSDVKPSECTITEKRSSGEITSEGKQSLVITERNSSLTGHKSSLTALNSSLTDINLSLSDIKSASDIEPAQLSDGSIRNTSLTDIKSAQLSEGSIKYELGIPVLHDLILAPPSVECRRRSEVPPKPPPRTNPPNRYYNKKVPEMPGQDINDSKVDKTDFYTDKSINNEVSFEPMSVSTPVSKQFKEDILRVDTHAKSSSGIEIHRVNKTSPTNLVARAIYSSKNKSGKKKNSLIQKKRKVSVSDVSPGEIQGYLHQRLRSKHNQNVHWEKRWFVLNQHCLYGFKSKESPKAECYIYLAGFTVTVASEVKSRTNAFKVYHTGTVFYFSAENEEALSSWLEIITGATFNTDLSNSAEDILYSETDDDSDSESTSKSSTLEKPDGIRKFNSLKKFTCKKRTETNSVVGSTSLDRKWFFNKSNNQKNVLPVPTAQFRSYRKIPPSTTIGNFTSHIPNFANKMDIPTLQPAQNTSASNVSVDLIPPAAPQEVYPKPRLSNHLHASNPSLFNMEYNAFQFHMKTRPKQPDNIAGFITLKELMDREVQERKSQFNEDLPPINPNLIRPDVVYGEIPIRPNRDVPEYRSAKKTHLRTASDCSEPKKESSCFGKRSSSIKSGNHSFPTKNKANNNSLPRTPKSYETNSFMSIKQKSNSSKSLSKNKERSYEMIYCPQTTTDVQFAQNRTLDGRMYQDTPKKNLKSAMQYTPMALPLTPDEKLKFNPKFAFELNLDEKATHNKSGKLKQFFMKQDSKKEKKSAASPKLPKGSFSNDSEISWPTSVIGTTSFSVDSFSSALLDASETPMNSSPPTTDYPGLEYPPVFEPETYSLANPQGTLLRKQSKRN